MDQMEKVSAVRTRRYNDFPRQPVQEADQPPAGKRLWFFEDGSGEMKDLLGGKGAGLAEMTRAKLPVPPGFTLTTEVCLAFYEAGRRLPDGLSARDPRGDARARAPDRARASASPRTRCSCPCAAARASRCPA